MERLKERLAIASKALASLEELLAVETPTRVERDAAIQRFEYTFEATWKAAERFLRVIEGVTVGSPKGCMRATRAAGLLTEDETVLGLEMVDDRNLTVHTYDERLAERIHGNLRRYARLLKRWLAAMSQRLDDLNSAKE